MIGIVLWGINNIFSIRNRDSGEIFECRFKGKVLKSDTSDYNPLAPGDLVEYVHDEAHADGQGLIINRQPRENSFGRWNIKRNTLQTIAANIDLALIITSPGIPPFRPRFIDRVLVSSMRNNIPAAIFMNKSDQEFSPGIMNRWKHYAELGYPLFKGSALNPETLNPLKEFIAQKRVLFFGQSGVGKSSLINAIIPGASQRTADVSEKYARGRHTTNYGFYLDQPGGGAVVDTPGVRDYFLYDIPKADLIHYFPEFLPLAQECRFSGCSHLREPGCRVKEAVENGIIHEDRYESYNRIIQELNNPPFLEYNSRKNREE